MITFEQARQIVADNRAGSFPPGADFQVATWGWENEDKYLIVSGAYASVYPPRNEEDEKYITPENGPVVTVDKSTGEYEEHWGSDEFGLPFSLPDSTPIGTRTLEP